LVRLKREETSLPLTFIFRNFLRVTDLLWYMFFVKIFVEHSGQDI